MEKNNELVVYGEKGKIVECKFTRVDLQNPPTILSYCSDVKDAITQVLESTAQMSIETEEEKLDNKLIEQISSFGTVLDESEKDRNGSKSLVKGTKKFLAKLGINYFKEALEKESYAGRYKEYCDMLDKVALAIERQKQNTLNDIELKNGIINEMLPLINQLEVMIEVGLKDKEEYDLETERLKQEMEPNSIDTENAIQYRTQISAIFANKINELQKALVLYKQQVQSYRLQQNTDMELVMSNESYLKDSAPILKAQGSVMVFNRIQAERIETQKALDKATNDAIKENAKQLQVNSQGVVDLSVNGGIQTTTIEELNTAIKSGIDTFRNGRKLKEEKNKRDSESLRKLNASLNEYQEELLNLIDERVMPTEIKSSVQKRLGGK